MIWLAARAWARPIKSTMTICASEGTLEKLEMVNWSSLEDPESLFRSSPSVEVEKSSSTPCQFVAAGDVPPMVQAAATGPFGRVIAILPGPNHEVCPSPAV